jgi:hypothetical protein
VTGELVPLAAGAAETGDLLQNRALALDHIADWRKAVAALLWLQ